ncbi:MAG: hypothetical protein QOD52_1288, partial [Gaiellaceae bacterium]|nr:hypothetical protein [Gaiellaceae bacterium]
VAPEGGEMPSDEELAAMEAAERAAQEAAAPAAAPSGAVEYVDEEERAVSPADAALSGDDSPAQNEPEQSDEQPEWRADAEAALRDQNA